jgi:hypothetical protein
VQHHRREKGNLLGSANSCFELRSLQQSCIVQHLHEMDLDKVSNRILNIPARHTYKAVTTDHSNKDVAGKGIGLHRPRNARLQLRDEFHHRVLVRVLCFFGSSVSHAIVSKNKTHTSIQN